MKQLSLQQKLDLLNNNERELKISYELKNKEYSGGNTLVNVQHVKCNKKFLATMNNLLLFNSKLCPRCNPDAHLLDINNEEVLTKYYKFYGNLLKEQTQLYRYNLESGINNNTDLILIYDNLINEYTIAKYINGIFIDLSTKKPLHGYKRRLKDEYDLEIKYSLYNFYKEKIGIILKKIYKNYNKEFKFDFKSTLEVIKDGYFVVIHKECNSPITLHVDEFTVFNFNKNKYYLYHKCNGCKISNPKYYYEQLLKKAQESLSNSMSSNHYKILIKESLKYYKEYLMVVQENTGRKFLLSYYERKNIIKPTKNPKSYGYKRTYYGTSNVENISRLSKDLIDIKYYEDELDFLSEIFL